MYNPNLYFHFVGIGGSGMSGIAEILLRNGFQVSGTDLNLSSVCRRLESLGAVISEGHAASHLPDNASLLVYSSAVPTDNPEVREAISRGIPVIKRAEVLAELMRLKFGVGVAGSHGKTTTTSMIGWVLEQGDLDPTVIVGGQVKSFGSGGRAGQSDYLVAEADESDRSFLLLKPSVAVVTNIDLEHLSAYADDADLYASFEKFIHSVPFYGLAVLCADDPYLLKFSERYDRRKLLYGFSESAEIRGVVHEVNADGVLFSVYRKEELLFDLQLPAIGRHFAQNALAAIAVGLEFGVSPETLRKSLASWPGVGRRLELVGERSGVSVYNDYGHHPVEIEATLGALDESFRKAGRRVLVAFQPHRYSRTKECYQEFCEAFKHCDELFITDIFAAGETSVAGISGHGLANDIRHDNKHFTELLPELHQSLLSEVSSGDVVLFLGAGSIGRNASSFLEAL